MSAEDDALRAMAANRGCKLIKSRRRKPGGDFGRFGLKDAQSGKEVFGFGARGLTARAEEIESFLRSDAVAGWKRSLIAPVGKAEAPARRRRAESPAREPKKAARERRKEAPKKEKAEPASKVAAKSARRREPEPPRPPRVREARPADADTIAHLLDQLGYEVTAADVRRRLQGQRKAGQPVLVAERERRVIGCLSWHVTPVIHRPRPVGRITMLVVAEAERGGGIGSLLVEAAAERLREQGCGLLEVTSNIRRMRAHAFYERLGFERTSYRFARTLQE